MNKAAAEVYRCTLEYHHKNLESVKAVLEEQRCYEAYCEVMNDGIVKGKYCPCCGEDILLYKGKGTPILGTWLYWYECLGCDWRSDEEVSREQLEKQILEEK